MIGVIDIPSHLIIYIMVILNILELVINSFNFFMFEVRLYQLMLQGVKRTIIDHANGFKIIDTRRNE